ncbi:MAG: hypothetical protein QXP61_10440 [Nitrososphaerales archaeon]
MKRSVVLLVVASVVATLTVIIITFGTSSSLQPIELQRERIYIESYRMQYYEKPPSPRYVKISDMKPSSMGFFTYPSSKRLEAKDDHYYKFMLVRLPSWLGGDKNDVSSFRAYSAVDLSSHCIVLYWPDRGKIEDPCTSHGYRVIDGLSYYPAIKFLRTPTAGELPKLDLSIDEEGYIYVEPPTWRENKNGVVGMGRIIPREEVMKSSEMIRDGIKN